MTFPCTGCGACCRSIANVPELGELMTPEGACKHLTPTNACAIYDDRPKVCRVDDMQPEVMTRAEWYRRNQDACRTLHLQVYGEPMRAC